MRRMWAITFILLVFGGMINVAIAWACEIQTTLDRGPRLMARGLGTNVRAGGHREATRISRLPKWPGRCEAGLPMRSLYWRFQHEDADGIRIATNAAQNSIEDPYVLLPLRPLYFGFAVNTACYAALLWIIFVLPAAYRQRLRKKRRMCRACGYPIGSSAFCTECGAALPGPAGDINSNFL